MIRCENMASRCSEEITSIAGNYLVFYITYRKCAMAVNSSYK